MADSPLNIEDPGASEQDLVAQARAGDSRAFDRLMQAHYTLAYNTAYRMLGRVETAEDACVEAFVRAFRSLDRFRGESSFSTWIYRIVTNVCLDQLRGNNQTPQSLDEGLGPDDASPREIPDEREDPQLMAERRRRQELVHRALTAVSPEHRAVLVLYDLNGFSYEEIGSILGVPVGTVKSRLNRARHALKEELAEHLELFE